MSEPSDLWLACLWLAVLCLLLGVVGEFYRSPWRPRWSPLRVGTGLGMVLAATAVGGLVTSVEVEAPPEPRGIGVVVDGARASSPRQHDLGLSVVMSVQLADCDGWARVRVTIAPTAEFWIDNDERLAQRAVVHLAVPDDSADQTPVAAVMRDLRAWSSSEGHAVYMTDSPTQRQPAQDRPEILDSRRGHRVTFVEVEVPRWGETMNPLNVEFSADWATPRSVLGGCYLTLPALAGFPTALSAAQVTGTAVSSDEDIPEENVRWLVLESESAGIKAPYRFRDEVTRGVTMLTMPGHTLDQGASLPAPDATIEGEPAWTCRSTIPEDVESLVELEPGDEAGDVLLSRAGDSTVSLSASRIDEVLDHDTCAAFVAVESEAVAPRHSLILISVGTVISLGIQLVLAGLRREKGQDA